MLRKRPQTDAELMSDRVFAAVYTGNIEQARTIYIEYGETDPAAAETLWHDVATHTGIAL